jgi:hypothetical protein
MQRAWPNDPAASKLIAKMTKELIELENPTQRRKDK